jgi:hypothetical protein
MSTLLLITALAAIGLFWLDSARARELANAISRVACERQGVQFLDETVAFARMGLRWTRAGLRIRRMFRFEFSPEGVTRRAGYVLLLGTQLERLHLDWPDQAEPTEPPAGPVRHPERKVVPFRRDH